MVFTSWAFLFFFSVVVAALRVLPGRNSRQVLILLASIYFYASWQAVFLLLLAAPSVIDYYCALGISRSTNPRHRRALVVFSIVSNLSLLAYFKYANFFVAAAARLVGWESRVFDITLPVGISFFTFKALSYTIDVYRKDIEICAGWHRFAMFITYFPELVAGPIVRASVFLPQLKRSLRFSATRLSLGLQIILLGATKKLLVADRLSTFSDAVFGNPAGFSPLTNLLAVIAYSLQIYCDFSGYSDIAIGTSKIIGFDLPENFNMPYLSTSLPEFWNRWHITLSHWLRDYLFFPLGANFKGRVRGSVNLLITMLLGGLWHGASWTFVAWGLLHGAGLVAHRLLHDPIGKRLPRWAAWALTYAFVCATWVFFRCQDFQTATVMFSKILLADRGGVDYIYSPLFMLLPLVLAAHYFGRYAERRMGRQRFAAAPPWLAKAYDWRRPRFAIRGRTSSGIHVLLPNAPYLRGFVGTAWILSLFLFAEIDTSPFIYFQF